MRICHVTSHLPPDQAANALLPWHLGRWAAEAGDEPAYVAHPPRSAGSAATGGGAEAERALPGPVTWIEPRARGRRVPGLAQVSSLLGAARIRRASRDALAAADIVHVHSNGLLPEVAGLLAARAGKPVVLTLYGTEIWHYGARGGGLDLFTRLYRAARHVTFYSVFLRDRAVELGLGRNGVSVIYPPVAGYFATAGDDERRAARAELGVRESRVLLNVKRLHPLAGQRRLLEAMPAVLQAHPDTRLVICGTGPLREDLAAQASALGVAHRVTFTGLVDNRTVARYQQAADLFVLPSELEALPTVAVEALAAGTPVVSTDNPGGVELGRLFGEDVRVVERSKAGDLASAIVEFLAAPRRTRPSSDGVLEREFSPAVVAQRFRQVYREALQ